MGAYNSPPDLVAVIRSHSRRLDALEKSRTIQVTAGAPPAGQDDGALTADKTGLFLYVVLNGVARRVAVT